MENQKLEIKEFSVKESELMSLVACTENVTKEAGEVEIKKHIKILRGAQIEVEKEGKLLRDGANKFRTWVIEKENALTDIVEPELQRLGTLASEIAQDKLKEQRLASLPIRRDRLSALEFTGTDEFILSFDDADFETHINELIAEKNERTRQDLERRERDIKEKEEKALEEKIYTRGKILASIGMIRIGNDFNWGQQRYSVQEVAEMTEEQFDKLFAETKDEYDKDQAEKAESDRQDKEKDEARIRKEEQDKADKREADRIENEKKEKEEKERKEKAEADKLAQEKDYQHFLTRNGYSESLKENFIIRNTGKQCDLFVKVDTYIQK
jgi:hypothetical protein